MAPPKYDKNIKKRFKEKSREEEYSEGKKIEIQKAIIEQQKKERKDKTFTLSIAVPGSILDNRLTPMLDTILAGQIARAAAIFQIDEIVVFDETNSIKQEDDGNFYAEDEQGHSNLKLAKILQYLECPQYLRKLIYPIEEDLKFAGVLYPMNMPHHLRATDWYPYREGLVTDKTPNNRSLVDIGLGKELEVTDSIEVGTRVTIKLAKGSSNKSFKGFVVPASEPQKELKTYWGYNVRMAKGLGTVLSESPYSKGYDLILGTSDKGQDIKTVAFKPAKHILIVFGGVKGLETSILAEEAIKDKKPEELFHHYLNTRPNQGTRTIRTEEAIIISLEAIISKLEK